MRYYVIAVCLIRLVFNLENAGNVGETSDSMASHSRTQYSNKKFSDEFFAHDTDCIKTKTFGGGHTDVPLPNNDKTARRSHKPRKARAFSYRWTDADRYIDRHSAK